MKFRRLGKTNINVSVVGVGTWQFGGEWGINYTQKEATAIIQRAKELEINLLDTAECYGDHTSERFVGEAIKGEREDWIVASKFGHKFHSNFKRTNIFDPQGVLLQLEDFPACAANRLPRPVSVPLRRKCSFFQRRALDHVKPPGRTR